MFDISENKWVSYLANQISRRNFREYLINILPVVFIIFIFLKIKTTCMPEAQHYSVPIRYRKMENLHIVFWLLKDISWCMTWKPLGILMIFPTLIIAVVISYRNREYVSELAHNIAIVFWISANSYWMISEFLGFDTKLFLGTYTYKHLAVIPFAIGILILAWFYILWQPKHKGVEEKLK